MTQAQQAKRPLKGRLPGQSEANGDASVQPVDGGGRVAEVEKMYRAQIGSLREEAELENIAINESSVSAFWSFVKTATNVRVAEIFIADSGDLSAEWRTGPENHFELRFLGENRVNYVYFVQRHGEANMSQGYGVEDLSRVGKLIDALDLQTLVYA